MVDFLHFYSQPTCLVLPTGTLNNNHCSMPQFLRVHRALQVCTSHILQAMLVVRGLSDLLQ